MKLLGTTKGRRLHIVVSALLLLVVTSGAMSRRFVAAAESAVQPARSLSCCQPSSSSVTPRTNPAGIETREPVASELAILCHAAAAQSQQSFPPAPVQLLSCAYLVQFRSLQTASVRLQV